MVASTMAYSMSGSSETASNSRLKTSAFTQSRNRLKTVFQWPNSGGRSRHGLPVRAIHNTASTNRRLSSPLRPGSDLLPQAMRLHLRPLGVSQHISVHPKLEAQYPLGESQISTDPSRGPQGITGTPWSSAYLALEARHR